MVIGCPSKAIKCLVFFFNFLAFIAGCGLLGAGIAGMVNGQIYTEIAKYAESDVNNVMSLRSALILSIVVGGILALLGFLGCCGAWCENQCLLGIFITFMLIMLIIQLTGGILAVVYKDKIKDGVTSALTKAAEKLEESEACELWKDVQKIPCCGLDGSWPTNPPGADKCSGLNVKCKGKPCPDALTDQIKKYAGIIAGVALGCLVLEIAAIIFSCCLCRSVKEQQQYRTV